MTELLAVSYIKSYIYVTRMLGIYTSCAFAEIRNEIRCLDGLTVAKYASFLMLGQCLKH